MEREEELRVSRRQFAIDVNGMELGAPNDHKTVVCTVRAAWFTASAGRITACSGTLYGWFGPLHHVRVPATPAEFARLADRRATWTTRHCLARWDGDGLWAEGPDPAGQAALRELLTAMLDGYPGVPQGHDGWWALTD